MFYISNELRYEIWFKNIYFFANYDQIMLIVKLRTSKYQKNKFTTFFYTQRKHAHKKDLLWWRKT
jgi:hypothetical protein